MYMYIHVHGFIEWRDGGAFAPLYGTFVCALLNLHIHMYLVYVSYMYMNIGYKHSNNSAMTWHTQLTVQDAHMVTVLITCIKTGKIFFESLVICIISVVSHFGVYRLIPKLHVKCAFVYADQNG